MGDDVTGESYFGDVVWTCSRCSYQLDEPQGLTLGSELTVLCTECLTREVLELMRGPPIRRRTHHSVFR